jgi:proton glutamate symport protein
MSLTDETPAAPPDTGAARKGPENAKARKRASGTGLIFLALVLGVLAGGIFPEASYPILFKLFQFFSKAFIGLIKGIIVPLLISTIIVGIAQTGDFKAVRRMGGKALLYFEAVTTIALGIGLLIANTVKPGANLPLKQDAHVALAVPKTGWEIALHALPQNLVKHAAEGDILPVVVFASIFGVALMQAGESGKPVLRFFEGISQAMFKYTDIIMKLTPLGVFGAMAYNVSHMASGHEVSGVLVKGWSAVFALLRSYAVLVASLYFALFILVTCVFIPIMIVARIPIVRFFRHVRAPALTAFSTASSEAALPRLLEEMEAFGVPRRVASFVIPAGYSFNLDGSTLYLVLASLSIAQAAHIDMPLERQIAMVLTFMLTSKGVAGVPRATLVIIAGTCQGFGIPGEAGVAMILAIDEVMDMARSAVNLIGNGLASAVIARWEGVLGAGGVPEGSESLPEAGT